MPNFLSAQLGHIVLESKKGKEVLETEYARFHAMIDKDSEGLDRIIHEDLVYIHSNGSVDSKKSFIEAISSGARYYDDIIVKGAQVRIYGKVGIINGSCTYQRKTEEGSLNNLSLSYTSVYTKIKGTWKQVSWQSFRLPQ
jgi:ketosteroid isomerase-like protein